MVTIEIKVNDRVVARAFLTNVSEHVSPVCDYGVSATTEPWADMDLQGYTLDIQNHNRNQSVWNLAKRAIDGILAKEKTRIGDPRYMRNS